MTAWSGNSILPPEFTSTSAPTYTGASVIAPLWKPTMTHDRQARAVYVKLSELPIFRTVNVSDSVNVDYDAHGRPVGVEVLL